MFSMQTLLTKDDRWFTLLETGADDAHASVKALAGFLNGREEARSLAHFVQVRRHEKRVVKQITEELLKTFLTPIERQDIEALSEALYKVPKTAEKFAERFLIAGEHAIACNFAPQVAMLEEIIDVMVLLVRQLRSGVRLDFATTHNDRIQAIEHKADEMMLQIVRELYCGDHSAVRVIVLKDLYELLERIFDRCRDVGNIIFAIALKYS